MSLRFVFVLLCCLAGAAHAEPARPTPQKAYLTLIIVFMLSNLPIMVQAVGDVSVDQLVALAAAIAAIAIPVAAQETTPAGTAMP